MEKIHMTLSVFYDGQFFTALFERRDADGYSAARRLFAVKPSDIEIYGFILNAYGTLRFSSPIDRENERPIPQNPKRRQREAAKAALTAGISTKAQAAIQAQREQIKAQSKKTRIRRDRLKEDRKFALKRLKKKQKHMGR